jgi:16S rRNA (uracil1498-N3)-methyltransferase
MTRRRFIADEVSGNRATLAGEHANHLIRVLRVRVGQEFDIATGQIVRRGKISLIEGDRVEFVLGDEVSAASLSEITLVLAVFKFDRMEWAIEKCTELGVSRIIPAITRRTETHLASASAKRVERWRRIVLQASEQSRRAAPPEVVAPTKLENALRMQAGQQIVLAESEDRTLLRDLVKPEATSGINLAIGPEGGWSDDELQAFQQAGWISASLGNTILRAETAAIAATAIVASVLNSL